MVWCLLSCLLWCLVWCGLPVSLPGVVWFPCLVWCGFPVSLFPWCGVVWSLPGVVWCGVVPAWCGAAAVVSEELDCNSKKEYQDKKIKKRFALDSGISRYIRAIVIYGIIGF